MENNNSEIIKIASDVIDIEVNSILRWKMFLSDDFVKAVRILSGSEKIIVTGIGKSGLIGKKIAATLTSVGCPSVFLHPVEALHGDIGIAGSGDSALVLSKSGSTAELIALFPYLKSRNIKIVSIVGNVNSYIAEQSDSVINASVELEACPFNLAPTSSTTVALVLADALAVACMKLKNFEQSDFALNHPNGQLGRNMTLRVKDIMHSGEQLPIINSDATFKDAVIEITKKGLGCVCIVDSQNKLSGIVTDGDVRRTLQKYEDLRGLIVRDIMTKNPINILPEIFLGDALSIMENRQSQINVLPVVDSENICIGVIRLHDIVKKEI